MSELKDIKLYTSKAVITSTDGTEIRFTLPGISHLRSTIDLVTSRSSLSIKHRYETIFHDYKNLNDELLFNNLVYNDETYFISNYKRQVIVVNVPTMKKFADEIDNSGILNRPSVACGQTGWKPRKPNTDGSSDCGCK